MERPTFAGVTRKQRAPHGRLRGVISPVIFSLGVFLSLSSAASNTSSPSLAEALSLGGHHTEDARLKDALLQCARHAPSLSPALCVDKFWVPRFLLDRQAETDNLRRKPAMRQLKADILHQTLHNHLSQRANATKNEVETYIREHSRDYQAPLRIRVFRILLSTKEKAQALLKKLGPKTTLIEFRKMAREDSMDRATNERGGDLGFLWPDGSTDIPQVRAAPSLYQAALTLQEGEIAQQPIAEEDNFAIIWRRGSKPAKKLTAASRKSARLHVMQAQTEEKIQELLTRLTENRVSERKNIRLGKLRRKKALLFKTP